MHKSLKHVIMILISNPDKSQWQEILKRPVMNTENLFDTVRSVIDRVKEEGDRAVLDYEENLIKWCWPRWQCRKRNSRKRKTW